MKKYRPYLTLPSLKKLLSHLPKESNYELHRYLTLFIRDIEEGIKSADLTLIPQKSKEAKLLESLGLSPSQPPSEKETEDENSPSDLPEYFITNQKKFAAGELTMEEQEEFFRWCEKNGF